MLRAHWRASIAPEKRTYTASCASIHLLGNQYLINYPKDIPSLYQRQVIQIIFCHSVKENTVKREYTSPSRQMPLFLLMPLQTTLQCSINGTLDCVVLYCCNSVVHQLVTFHPFSLGLQCKMCTFFKYQCSSCPTKHSPFSVLNAVSLCTNITLTFSQQSIFEPRFYICSVNIVLLDIHSWQSLKRNNELNPM